MQSDVQDSGDLLERAVSALRELPVPDGPPALTAQRTIQSLRLAESRPLAGSGWRLGNGLLRFAAVFILGSCAGALAVTFLRQHPTVASSQGSSEGTPEHGRGPQPRSPRVVASSNSPNAVPREVAPQPDPFALAADVSVAGHVYYMDVPPARRAIDTGLCLDCAKAIREPLYDESLIVNDDSTIQNVVVSISSGLPPGERFPVSQQPAVLDQKNCRFVPHVLAAMVGQPVLLRNSDPIAHSVRSMDAEETPAFNVAQPVKGERRLDPLRTIETFKVKCDLHPWMTAWWRTFDHPYFCVTTHEGTFTLRGLPPGKYRLKAWHETLGVQEREVTVTDGEPAVVDFAFYSR